MICEFLNFIAPCYDLVRRYQPDHFSSVSQNISYFVTCRTRCEGLNRKVPSYSMVKHLNSGYINEMCNRSTCTFPIDVFYDKGSFINDFGFLISAMEKYIINVWTFLSSSKRRFNFLPLESKCIHCQQWTA